MYGRLSLQSACGCGLFYAHRYEDVYPFGQLYMKTAFAVNQKAAITYAGSGLTVSFARRRLPSWLPFPVPVEHKQVDQMLTSERGGDNHRCY